MMEVRVPECKRTAGIAPMDAISVQKPLLFFRSYVKDREAIEICLAWCGWIQIVAVHTSLVGETGSIPTLGINTFLKKVRT